MEFPYDNRACVSHCNSDGGDGRDGSDGPDAHELISGADSRFGSLRNSFNMHSGRMARVVAGAALGLIVTALLVKATTRGRVVSTVGSDAAMVIFKDDQGNKTTSFKDDQGDQGASLFCWSMMTMNSYEPDLLRKIYERQAGIFACDAYAVFCTEEVELVPGVNAIQVEKRDVGVSEDLTAANTEQFMKIWDEVKNSGLIWNADWTLKVDPDCVLLPWKLRPKLAAHNGKYAFVRNCNAWPDSPKFPCMFGALEILSQSAASAFADRYEECRNLPVAKWAEDLFITKCLEQLGVQPIDDTSVLTDGICTQSYDPPSKRPRPDNCQQDGVSAFHPFKDIEGWETCFDQANNAQ